MAARRLVTLGLEQIVGDPLLDVVGLAREDQERLVLRLPAEPCDRLVVAVMVRATRDAERRLHEGVRVAVGEDRTVGNLLDQPSAKHRCRDSKDDVVGRDLGVEILLLDRAPAGVGRPVVPAADHEQRVDSAVAGAGGRVLEPGLPHRPVQVDERRHDVACAEGGRHRDLGIHLGAGPAGGRLAVASGAAVEVEPWAESFIERVAFLEFLLRGGEERRLARRQAVQHLAGARGPTTNPGVPRKEELSRGSGRYQQNHRDGGHEYLEFRHGRAPTRERAPSRAQRATNF